jgi:hypothetical protein
MDTRTDPGGGTVEQAEPIPVTAETQATAEALLRLAICDLWPC